MTAQRTYTAKQWRHTQYASYFGYITQAIVNNLAPLLFLIFQDVYGIPLEKITLLVTVNFCVQLLVDMVAARFVDKIGYRPCIVAAHLFAAAGLAGLGLLPRLLPDPFVGLLGAVFLYAIGGGLIEVLISPIVEACPTDNKASVMSLLHSFYCWGSVGVILLSTLFLQLFGKGSWTVLALLWALLPLANALWFTKVPIAHLTEEGEGLPLGKLLTNKLFWIFAALMFAAGACELSMSQWASAFAESGLGVSKTVGDLAGPCLFAVLMGCARVIYAKFGDRLNLLNTQMLSAGLCVVAYLLAALSPNPLLALLGCGLCGLSVGILWPGDHQRGLPQPAQGGHGHVRPAGAVWGFGLFRRPHPGGHGLRRLWRGAENRPAVRRGVPGVLDCGGPGLQARPAPSKRRLSGVWRGSSEASVKFFAVRPQDVLAFFSKKLRPCPCPYRRAAHKRKLGKQRSAFPGR